MSIGYIIGFGLYWLTDIWFFIFLAGEVASLVYVSVTGSVFRQFLRRAITLRLHARADFS